MTRTRKIMIAVALAAPLLFLSPPTAEAQTMRGRTYYQPYGQRYYPETRSYYGPRTQYYRGYGSRGYGSRYSAPRYYQSDRGRYYQPSSRYYGSRRYDNSGGSVRVGPLSFRW